MMGLEGRPQADKHWRIPFLAMQLHATVLFCLFIFHRMPLSGNGTVGVLWERGEISGMFELEAFYEIDHAELPPKSPIHLKAIRVVKVSETTRLDVTVRFPSVLALRNYFAGDPDVGRNPELDEKFVMGTNQAVRILRRMVPELEMDEEKHMESFWLVSPKALECPPPVVMPAVKMTVEEEMEEVKSRLAPGGCLMALKYAGALAWGARRKVKYIGRHRELPVMAMEGEEDEVVVQEKKRSREEGVKMEKKKKRMKMKKTVEKKKVARHEKDEQSQRSRERWSSERYEAAEMKLLDIMKEKGAKIGNPIIRQALREEARKHIGDTGLLDHLLKHMAGKTVAEGAERFRRRHNAEGAMEYWLEPADLVEIRRKAGVVDPYWVPPPGWQLGDAIAPCQCGSDCKLELIHLKAELTSLKRDMEQQLSSQKQLEESYQNLLEWKAKVEGEMAEMSSCLQALKEEMQALKEEKEKKKKMRTELVTENNKKGNGGDDKEGGRGSGESSSITNNSSIILPINNSNNNNSNMNTNTTTSSTINSGSKRAAVRRSGFRICKPQGTFLWPDMASSWSPRTAVLGNDGALTLFRGCGLPTPPSASSATSPPFPSPVPPRASPGPDHLSLVPLYGFPRGTASSRGGVTTELALGTPSLSFF
ncbi:hypothetical protein J5N97_000911 [Dioscorea zingiberensis]|uniref:PTC1-like winged helix-turn-helix domain-containing protein n=1 Tax=Dioscorea zingiberensis TaxID=325984 RepID=A0A9D5H2R2_9LILI|nr:hypothetical protein J5N97_000911 [Dioscorea zingiberensis]